MKKPWIIAGMLALAGLGLSTPTGAAPGPPPNQRVAGRVPPNWVPGTGTIVTGTAAGRAEAVALAGYLEAPSTASCG
jgi:multidrug efflux pump subunit AcrA (membrane-fusion protein)